MNLGFFFEGTGQGVAGLITNVARLRDLCVEDARQKLHLEAGPGTHFGSYLAGKIAGVDWNGEILQLRRCFWLGLLPSDRRASGKGAGTGGLGLTPDVEEAGKVVTE